MLDECPEHEVVHGVALPGDARAVVAEELLGLVERVLGGLPAAEQERADPAHQLDHAPGVRRVDSPGQCLGGLQERRRREARRAGRPWTDVPPPWPGPGRCGRARRPGAPGGGRASGSRRRGSARSCSGPRPPTSRGRSASGPSRRPGSRRARGSARPRSRRRARCQSSESRARRGVSGMLMPSGPKRVRNRASPSSTWPLIRSWVEASRFSSRVSAAVADIGGRRGRPGPPRRPGRRWPAHRPAASRGAGLVGSARGGAPARSDRAAPRDRRPAPRPPGRPRANSTRRRARSSPAPAVVTGEDLRDRPGPRPTGPAPAARGATARRSGDRWATTVSRIRSW